METAQLPVGARLREWRARREISQLTLALDAGISARHLSFIETGRSRPGAAVILRLTETLGLPLRERNALLLAAGHAPAFPQLTLADPQMDSVREAIRVLLAAHEPNPGLVVDRHWNLVASNRAMQLLGGLIDPDLRTGPLNVMRVGLHPRGVARYITNLPPVHEYFVGRLRRQADLTGDAVLADLLAEVSEYRPPAAASGRAPAAGHILTPTMQLRLPDGTELGFFATVATFGTAAEITTAELSIELAFPADAATAAVLARVLS